VLLRMAVAAAVAWPCSVLARKEAPFLLAAAGVAVRKHRSLSQRNTARVAPALAVPNSEGGAPTLPWLREEDAGLVRENRLPGIDQKLVHSASKPKSPETASACDAETTTGGWLLLAVSKGSPGAAFPLSSSALHENS